MTLDPNIAALLVVDVSWQAKTGVDDYGNDQWADPITLSCYPTYGARQIQRADGTVYVSQQSLTFDASDDNVQAFQLGDRFTSVGIAGGQTMEAQEIAPVYSPGPGLGEPMTAWLVEVFL